jgi:hypothetical protein
MKTSHRIALLSLCLPALIGLAPAAHAQQLPGPAQINGQKVLTMISRDPPGVRCNNNIQIAAELSNVYKIPVVVMPVTYAGPGGDHNGMASYQIIADVLEIEGTPKQEQTGRLLEIRTDFDALKARIRGN